jgi:hypothetical protein
MTWRTILREGNEKKYSLELRLSYKLPHTACMRRSPEDEPSRAIPNRELAPSTSEIEGLIELGMKDEALRRARLNLRQNPITAKALGEALDAILTLADRPKPWANLVESAYERLPKRERPAVRCLVMSLRNACRNYEGGGRNLGLNEAENPLTIVA